MLHYDGNSTISIPCNMGTEAKIVENLKNIDEIKDVQQMIGNYDIVVKTRSANKGI